MKANILIALLLLTSCTTSEQNARSLLDRVEFGEDEIGCAEIRATIDLNPMPMITSNAALIVKKQKGENAPTC